MLEGRSSSKLSSVAVSKPVPPFTMSVAPSLAKKRSSSVPPSRVSCLAPPRSVSLSPSPRGTRIALDGAGVEDVLARAAGDLDDVVRAGHEDVAVAVAVEVDLRAEREPARLVAQRDELGAAALDDVQLVAGAGEDEEAQLRVAVGEVAVGLVDRRGLLGRAGAGGAGDRDPVGVRGRGLRAARPRCSCGRAGVPSRNCSATPLRTVTSCRRRRSAPSSRASAES